MRLRISHFGGKNCVDSQTERFAAMDLKTVIVASILDSLKVADKQSKAENILFVYNHLGMGVLDRKTKRSWQAKNHNIYLAIPSL